MAARANINLFKKIMIEEFIRELEHYLDVRAGRSNMRGDFTDKFILLTKSSLATVIGEIPVPGIQSVQFGLNLVIDFWNEERKVAKQDHANLIGHTIDPEKLRIILDIVAMEATRRYQLWLVEFSSDEPLEGVIPFAKTGVERMLEYILRNQLPITVNNLLHGLMVGRSGKYVQGYSNTELKIRNDHRHGLKHGAKSLFHLGHYTAEGVYGRSAFRTSDGISVLIADKDKYAHKKSMMQAADSPKLKLDHNDGYGYTKFLEGTHDPKGTHYPKYGFINVPEKDLPDKLTLLSKSQLNPSFQVILDSYQPILFSINRKQLNAYLKETTLDVSLLDYCRKTLNSPTATQVFFITDEENDGDLRTLDLEGRDLSDSIFNHCQFGNSLKNTKWQNSYLRGADFSDVTTAENADFRNAHLEFLKAPGVNLSQSNFIQTELHYADLSNVNLIGCNTLGTHFHQAILTDLKTDSLHEIMEQLQRQEQWLKAQEQQLQLLPKSFEQHRQEKTKNLINTGSFSQQNSAMPEKKSIHQINPSAKIKDMLDNIKQNLRSSDHDLKETSADALLILQVCSWFQSEGAHLPLEFFQQESLLQTSLRVQKALTELSEKWPLCSMVIFHKKDAVNISRLVQKVTRREQSPVERRILFKAITDATVEYYPDYTIESQDRFNSELVPHMEAFLSILDDERQELEHGYFKSPGASAADIEQLPNELKDMIICCLTTNYYLSCDYRELGDLINEIDLLEDCSSIVARYSSSSTAPDIMSVIQKHLKEAYQKKAKFDLPNHKQTKAIATSPIFTNQVFVPDNSSVFFQSPSARYIMKSTVSPQETNKSPK